MTLCDVDDIQQGDECVCRFIRMLRQEGYEKIIGMKGRNRMRRMEE